VLFSLVSVLVSASRTSRLNRTHLAKFLTYVLFVHIKWVLRVSVYFRVSLGLGLVLGLGLGLGLVVISC